ncbi:MAG: efflux RND transporter periplasmic adaptor subunit, partial [Dehalococcoidia bacterium]
IARLQISVAELQVRAAEAQFKAAELQVDVAKQAVEEAASELEIENLTAPFYGVVTSVDVEEGDIIPNSGMSQVTIVHLIDPSSMELGVDLDEIDIPGVALDQRAIISVDALPDVQLEGNVTSISPLPTVEAGVVLYNVKIGFDVPQGSGLKVGMSATADIIINERSGVLLVPDRAIKQDSQGNPVVWVMVGEQIEQRPVIVGISDGFQTEIIQGLSEGETVVMEMGVGVQPSTGPSGGRGIMPMMPGAPHPGPAPES